jgi:hypothetical protein
MAYFRRSYDGFVLEKYEPEGQPLITRAATIPVWFGKMYRLKEALCRNTERGLFCILRIVEHFVVVARQPNCTRLTYCDSWPEKGSWAKDDQCILRGKGFLCNCDDFDELEAVLAVRHLAEMENSITEKFGNEVPITSDKLYIQCTLFSDALTA